MQPDVLAYNSRVYLVKIFRAWGSLPCNRRICFRALMQAASRLLSSARFFFCPQIWIELLLFPWTRLDWMWFPGRTRCCRITSWNRPIGFGSGLCLTDPELISTREAQHFGLDELLLEQSTSAAPYIYLDD
jgi:hypothetical protein